MKKKLKKKNTSWTCPWCGKDEMWFDRNISYSSDGTEEGMKDRCTKCGRATDEFPNYCGC